MGSVRYLLDIVFGFLIWALHFLVIYCANALACARGIGTMTSTTQNLFKATLIAATLLAAAVVMWHAARRWRGRSQGDEFVARLKVGNDAIASIGIGVQLVPLLLLHLCR